MGTRIKNLLQGEVVVSYKTAISPERFRNIFSSQESNFILEEGLLEKTYILKPRKCKATQPITSGQTEEEREKESLLMQKTICELQFNPSYEIEQEWDYTNPESIRVYRDLKKVLEKNGIPYFILVEDEGPTTSFIAGGSNPRKNLRIKNQRPGVFPI